MNDSFKSDGDKNMKVYERMTARNQLGFTLLSKGASNDETRALVGSRYGESLARSRPTPTKSVSCSHDCKLAA